MRRAVASDIRRRLQRASVASTYAIRETSLSAGTLSSPRQKRAISAGASASTGTRRGSTSSRSPWGSRSSLSTAVGIRAANVSDDDEITTWKIAWSHLNEFPDHYTRLA